MQFNLVWLLHSLGSWATWALAAAAALWLSSRSRRQAFWVWLTDEHFYKNFGFLGLLWPRRERKRVWPKVMEDAKAGYLERLEKARQYRGGQLPKWWVALANIRFLVHMAFHVVEMSRTIVVTKRRPRAERVALSGTSTAHAANSGKLFIAVSGKMETSGRVFPRLVRQCAKCGKTFPVSGNKILCNDCDN